MRHHFKVRAMIRETHVAPAKLKRDRRTDRQKDKQTDRRTKLFLCGVLPRWTPLKRNYFKLYCRYEYTRPYMIKLKESKTTMTSSELTCLISFATAPLTCSERRGSENFKMKIYLSNGIQTRTTPVQGRKVSALDRSATLVRYQVEHL